MNRFEFRAGVSLLVMFAVIGMVLWLDHMTPILFLQMGMSQLLAELAIGGSLFLILAPIPLCIHWTRKAI